MSLVSSGGVGRGVEVAGAVGGAGEVDEVVAFGVVELQGAGDGVEDLVGDAGDGAAFELGVVLDAQPGERGDLARAAARAPAGCAPAGQPDLLRA